MTIASDPTPPVDDTSTWHLAAQEIARWPRAVTRDMRRKHQARADGRCRGPHGAALVKWPCSTWLLADTADRMRNRPTA
jgi:hypothetical protein